MSTETSEQISANERFADLRERIVSCLENLEKDLGDGAVFEYVPWKRSKGGGGSSAMLRGRLFEKTGAHVSAVHGPIEPALVAQLSQKQHSRSEFTSFWAGGVSVIAHPRNPHIPAVHLNVRRIEAGGVWFGGGADLTPMMAARRNSEDVDSIEFHSALEQVCATHGSDYETMRKACSDYFFLQHRGCERGIGGIFFDDYNLGGEGASLAFCEGIVEAFCVTYTSIVRRNAERQWTSQDTEEQERFRALYAEFNLLYDRGTLFGLRSGGNIEAILSSLPPRVRWD